MLLLSRPEHMSSHQVFSGVRVTQYLVLYVCFVDRCLSFFFRPLCCLFLFDLRILSTPLVSPNSSYCTPEAVIQEWIMAFPLTGLAPPHWFACCNSGYGFPTLYVILFLNYLRCDVIVRFVDMELLTITV